jgi:3-hydroxyisobutyrate dehydrogenase-like beta-hydroxyacid dehydrogenase
VAHSVSPFLNEQHLFVDLTSVGPGKVGEIEQVASAHGALFAKLALMGAVAAFGLQVPCAASGKGASLLAETLVPLGMKIQVLNEDPAAAATLKLCRSLFQKGIVSLALEALRVARKNGVEQEVISSLAETWNAEGFQVALNRLICSSTVHAKRRAAELNEAIDAFEEMGVALPVAKAGCQGFQELIQLQASGRFQEQAPKEFVQVIDALDG